jgi:2-phospho-L-lactate guanylyltransferase
VAQGTIKDYDDGTGAGSLLLDDGTQIAIDATSTTGSGLRTLRLGQRVTFEIEGEGETRVARGLHLVTFV